MSEESQHNEKQVHAYNQMMRRVKKTLGKAEKAAAPRLRQAIENAEERAVELGELSREEAVQIGDYLRRDLQDAGEYLAGDEAQEFKDWLRIDLNLIENQLFDMFLSVADQAKLDMLDFQEQLAEATEYRTGEITGPGLLACMDCGEELHFHAAGHIPPCPKCRGTYFTRPAET
ncbi:hypothetical protein Tel_02130 [Candidatus Tenderia electrophaga]|jgi:hypothetical protein|uniref:Zinc ribbon-containing protein n=1 Tax=Candidatus Tenderia electrophaga TaxID=1748243 RepID=A0A0S2TA74_9GAMM|nr:hypothetical protein Tel_02130 [Candidatus Tenderia electrophaga]